MSPAEQHRRQLEQQFVAQFELDSLSLASLPGPLTFMTSKYALALVLMALLLNRIQNIVVPIRVVQQPLPNHPPSFWHPILPINPASPIPRFLLRTPSLFLLTRALILMAIALLQASYPSAALGHRTIAWAVNTSMSDICWSTFVAVCLALAIGQLTAGLEGIPSSASTFNLFGYSFLLHMYASPYHHHFASEVTPTPTTPTTSPIGSTLSLSRPDKHIIITMMIPLLQLFTVQALGIRQRWARQRLVPTTICGLLSLAHFHYVLFFSPASYPLLNYLPSILESVLLLTTLITVILNAITQLLLTGSISHPLFGSGENGQRNLLGVHPSAMPNIDEDFSIAILRLGTASFEATGVAGLGNQVTPVAKPAIVLDYQGVKSLRDTKQSIGKGFRHEITDIHVTLPLGDPQTNGVGNSELYLRNQWLTEARKYVVVVGRVVFHLWNCALSHTPMHLFKRHTIAPSGGLEDAVSDAGLFQINDPPESVTADENDTIYRRFVIGESLSDVDQDSTYETSGSEADSDIESELESDEGTVEVLDLYLSLADDDGRTSKANSTPPSTSHLIAHLSSPQSSGPMTRRRYDSIRNPSPFPNEDSRESLDAIIAGRRSESTKPSRPEVDHDLNDTIKANCVICTVEPREVICWPCRCLAICDDCRANLASRSAAHKHSCPCCRKIVQGYSRIYIP